MILAFSENARCSLASLERQASDDQKSAKKAMIDVVSLRNVAHSSAKSETGKAVEKLRKEVKSLGELLQKGLVGDDRSLFDVAKDRFSAAVLFLGLKAGATASADGPAQTDYTSLVELDLASDVKGDATASALAHTHELRRFLKSLTLLPVENMDTFASLSEIMNLLTNIRAETTAEGVENAKVVLESHKESIDQLASSLRTAAKDLSRENRQILAARTKIEREKKSKEASEAQQRKQDEEVVAKRQLLIAKRSQHFLLDWVKAGHPAIRQVVGDGALELAWKTTPEELLASPFMLTGSDVLKKELPEGVPESGKAKGFLDAFAKAFTKQDAAKQAGQLMAPLRKAHGSDELRDLWALLVPAEHQMTEGLPSLTEKISFPWFFGVLDPVLTHAFEGEGDGHMGSIRVQVSGETMLLAMSAVDATKMAGERPTKDALLSVVSSLADNSDLEAHAKAMLAKGAHVFSGTIKASAKEPVALIVPPGWIVASKNHKAIAVGIRKLVLQKGESAQKNLASIVAAIGDASTPPAVSDYLDLLTVVS